MRVGGVRKQTQLASLIAFIGGRCEGEGGAGRGENKFVLVLDAACYAYSFTLCLSFSYLRFAVTASFDIKKFHRNATTKGGRVRTDFSLAWLEAA
jgi:hypothetical protein